MKTDDVLAYMASKPKKSRPHELKSDVRMLAVWLRLRNDYQFREDVVIRHGLDKTCAIDESDQTHEHAISNAWGHAMQVWVQDLSKR